MTSAVASRERVVIVDRDLDFGLKLADCLASSGYHAVLGRSLAAMLNDLSEMQPGAILLSSDSREHEMGDHDVKTLRMAKALCPQAPVITLMKPRQDLFAAFHSRRHTAIGRSEPPKVDHVEELLQRQLGISCARML